MIVDKKIESQERENEAMDRGGIFKEERKEEAEGNLF
jgi:hypothetical protein